MKEKSFYDNWNTLIEHKIFNVSIRNKNSVSRVSYFERCLDITVVKVDSNTKKINLEDESKNTDVLIWLEISRPKLDIEGDFGKSGEIILVRDDNLSVEGSTFEEAILKLEEKVLILEGKDASNSECHLNI